MWWLEVVIAPVVGGILAASGFIVAKKPQAQELINKLTPYQAGVGVFMMVMFVLNVVNGALGMIPTLLKIDVVAAVAMILILFSELVVGFLLGFGLIAKLLPGEGNAEQRAANIQKKLMAIQVPLGFVSIVAGILGFLKFRH